MDIDIDKLFNRRIQLECNVELPSEEHWFKEDIWKDDEFEQMKFKLNQCKSLLNDKDIQQWGNHTSFTDLSGSISEQIVNDLEGSKPELLTRAWMKLYEILSNFNLVNCENETVKALFLCEAPGSFITCLNHFIKSKNHNCTLDWVANTLNPYYEGIDENAVCNDEFIKNGNLLKNWFFASTNTGDILDDAFLNDLIEHVKGKHEFDIVTADGGLNCIDVPEFQEQFMIPLIVSEMIIALNMLKPGGCLVIKSFTIFECQTLCCLYLLCASFQQVDLFKPISSKHGNSELYIICVDYKPNYHLDKLLSNLYCKRTEILSELSIFEKKCIKNFLNDFQVKINLFVEAQMEVIRRNLNSFRNKSEKYKNQIMIMKNYIACSFVIRYHIKTICLNDRLSNESSIHMNLINLKKLNSLTSISCSYNKRKNQDTHLITLEWTEKLKIHINDLLENIHCDHFFKWQFSNSFEPNNIINHIFGKPYETIKNSRFCNDTLLKIFYYLNSELFCTTNQSLKKQSSTDYSEILFKQLFNQLDIEFYYITYFGNNHSRNYIENLLHKPTALQSEEITNPTFILIIDYYTPELSTFSSLTEIQIISESLIQLLNYVQTKSLDLLIINVGFSLTRLTCGILYLLTKLFLKYVFVPSNNGILCLFYQWKTSSFLLEEFNQICCQFKSYNEDSKVLLEVISTPQLMLGNTSSN